ncbi:L-serine ammonia-lyase, iron-sulfur-dependent, subunit alpha [Acetohalobium arabaticum]|uniref:L-serine dehydratase n=1 Tax=Acetohalobium arabaticum (strain ATCC 49924 / DSM 5501 / Z-7288) TaxID=574087 RepID=D9QQC5_ACEAZ|nr:L-serine ammonia-lyase, iron-sulfur-dependent, subunit alpha [Acetohalobium arabaticum]ADL12716.1 L-serine ammonia-lyase [Acetohalobium arabaticum DSM 5501]
MYDFETVKELINLTEKHEVSITEVVIKREKELSEKSEVEIRKRMNKSLEVMREAIKQGLTEDITSMSGLVGGDAKLIASAREREETITGNIMSQAITRALAVSEVNAAMGKIVAVPTAGSCGILPGALLTIADDIDISDKEIVDSLFVASGIGLAVAKQASVSGAAGGCQAECGTASGMAAAAITYLLGGDNNQVANATAIALKNILGLVCDPVAGLVEIPCIKRNTMGAANALVAAEMALAGVESKIPIDEVIIAMKEVGEALPEELRETSLGGLAATPTGCRIKEQLKAD